MKLKIPVSIGIAPTKTLAKLANRYAKKHPETGGVFDLCKDEPRKEYLQTVDVSDIWGIGFQYSKLLKKYSINTVWDLSQAPMTFSYKKVGIFLFGIMPERDSSPNLFGQFYQGSQSQILMKTFDQINQRMGRDTLRFASSGISNEWQMCREYLTNKFTTSWQELLEVA